MFAGDKAFRLYDTYGLPRDFIEDVSRDAGIKVDWDGFERAMQEQRTRARASWKGAHKQIANPVYVKLAETFKTEPEFYFGATAKDCRIEAGLHRIGISQRNSRGRRSGSRAGSQRDLFGIGRAGGGHRLVL